jgi:large subunit ribosomal protein L17
MRHRKNINLLSRPADQRRALLRSLTTELLRYKKITTTETKAKALRESVEHMITLAKRGDLHARRQAESFIMDKDVTKALFNEMAPLFADRNGGYVRVTKTMPRRGDNAPMAIAELML